MFIFNRDMLYTNIPKSTILENTNILKICYQYLNIFCRGVTPNYNLKNKHQHEALSTFFREMLTFKKIRKVTKLLALMIIYE